MNKKIIFVFAIVVFVFTLIIIGLYLVRQKKSNLLSNNPAPTQNTFQSLSKEESATYHAYSFQEGNNPIYLKINIPVTPSKKGITGIKAVYQIEDQNEVTLEDLNFKATLLPPWQYLRKEILDQKLIIEAIYMKGQKNGDTNTELTLAQLQKSGKIINLTLNTKESQVFAKESNLAFPLENKID